MDTAKRIAEIEKKLITPKWEYTGEDFIASCYSPISVEESLWLVKQLKACGEELAWRRLCGTCNDYEESLDTCKMCFHYFERKAIAGEK